MPRKHKAARPRAANTHAGVTAVTASLVLVGLYRPIPRGEGPVMCLIGRSYRESNCYVHANQPPLYFDIESRESRLISLSTLKQVYSDLYTYIAQ